MTERDHEQQDTTEREPVDFFEQIADAAAEDLPKILQRLRDIAQDGGVKTVRIKCEHCGQYASTEVEIADTEDLRKLMESYASIQLRAKAQRPDDETDREARRLVRDVRALSNEEIAAEIVQLERGE